jgi:hypothetical protein
MLLPIPPPCLPSPQCRIPRQHSNRPAVSRTTAGVPGATGGSSTSVRGATPAARPTEGKRRGSMSAVSFQPFVNIHPPFPLKIPPIPPNSPHRTTTDNNRQHFFHSHATCAGQLHVAPVGVGGAGFPCPRFVFGHADGRGDPATTSCGLQAIALRPREKVWFLACGDAPRHRQCQPSHFRQHGMRHDE